ncbi:MAG: 4-hydroxy-tetrahydrodipicolinate synthase [Pseudomonadota bacterium]|nr:4-hydroxy-tetrahydrodipicolinate synthase [Pseudomonadota bacterium]MEC8797213.1 4-hydroxy-tetrahydrodipicolinate synthase [Pseudomonadota bacterium]|tara:strand:- start:49 stop:924 length:876 start_codon:yes stop_codon:yes gene_type:complete
MFKGSIVAIVTPFKNGKIDETSLRNLVNWHIDEGTHGIVPVGTTGESPTLDHSEHREVVEIVIDQVNNRVPVIAGAGSNSTSEAISLLMHAESVGADAALIVTPYYNKPTQEGLYEHFKAINRASMGIPIIIYNIPPRSIVDMSVEVMGKLSNLENIIGVKDATSDLSRVEKQKKQSKDGFLQFSGEDITAFEFMKNGGNGCISVTANVLPKLCSDFQNLCLEGNYDEALKIHKKLEPMHNALFIETSPSPVKYVLSKMGRIEDELRLPLVSIRQETKEILDKVISDLDLI